MSGIPASPRDEPNKIL
jgi:hypothetical protein